MLETTNVTSDTALKTFTNATKELILLFYHASTTAVMLTTFTKKKATVVSDSLAEFSNVLVNKKGVAVQIRLYYDFINNLQKRLKYKNTTTPETSEQLMRETLNLPVFGNNITIPAISQWLIMIELQEFHNSTKNKRRVVPLSDAKATPQKKKKMVAWVATLLSVVGT